MGNESGEWIMHGMKWDKGKSRCNREYCQSKEKKTTIHLRK